MSDEKASYRAMRVAEKYKAHKLDYQERHKATLCKVYLSALLVTIGLALFTFMVIRDDDAAGCEGSFVRWSLYLVLAMHATNIVQQVCTLTGLENFFCSGLCNLCFDIYEIAVLIFMMWQLSDATHCLNAEQGRTVYVCLLINTIAYWGFFFISLFIKVHSYCSGPSKDEVEKEVDMEEKVHSNKIN